MQVSRSIYSTTPITTLFGTFIGDGAYDGKPVSQAVFDLQSEALVIVPPHKTAVVSSTGDTLCDQHIKAIAENGRMTWQRNEGASFAPSESGSRIQCV